MGGFRVQGLFRETYSLVASARSGGFTSFTGQDISSRMQNGPSFSGFQKAGLTPFGLLEAPVRSKPGSPGKFLLKSRQVGIEGFNIYRQT